MKARRLAALALVLGLSASAAGAGPEFSFSLSGGSFSPGGKDYRRMYGSSFIFAAEAWWAFKRGCGVSVGLTGLRDEGRAEVLIGVGEDYPLRFERLSVPVMFVAAPKIGRFVLRLGAGPVYHSYREKWLTADIDFEGRKIGTRLAAALVFPVFGRLSVVGSVVTDSISAEKDSPPGNSVELGGLQILAGVSWRVF